LNLILVTSPTAGAGKTTAIVALGQRLRRHGRAVDYRRLPGPGAETDAAFVAQALRQGSSAGLITSFEDATVPGEADVRFVEANANGLPSTAETLRRLAARALLVARYQSSEMIETVERHAAALPHDSTAVLLSAVPEKAIRQTQGRTIPRLHEWGLPVVGVIPQDRILLGMSVGNLAESLGAEVLCATDQLGLPVEAVMIAAMSDEGAETYFRRIARKAVVAGGDRPDIHLPALATDTSCIVLTEGRDPDPTVFKTAEDEGVPLLKVGPTTLETLENISSALANARFHQEHKVGRAAALFASNVDDDALERILGIRSDVPR
jgi:BioD-like phosphotransacetylase family protein